MFERLFVTGSGGFTGELRYKCAVIYSGSLLHGPRTQKEKNIAKTSMQLVTKLNFIIKIRRFV